MRRFSPLHFAFVLLAGCSADMPTDSTATEGVLEALRAPTPFAARCEMTIQPPTPVGPGLIRQLDIGECRGAHLGQTRFISDKVINVIAGTQTLEATFVAANGDVLRASGTGTSAMIAPGSVAFNATITFTGGTGRFEQAAGQASIEGEADLAAGTSRMAAEGTITY